MSNTTTAHTITRETNGFRLSGKFNSVVADIFASHFSFKVRKALTKKGITLLGLTTIPGAGPMAFANGETGYEISDNGTGRTLTFRQMLDAAD